MTKSLQIQEILLDEESQEDFSQQAQVLHCIKIPSTPSSAERELHELTHFPFRTWSKSVREQKDFMVSLNIRLKRSQVLFNQYLIRQDGRTSHKHVFNKAHSGPLVHFGERVLAHVQSQPPSQKLHLRAQPQKHYSLWLGKRVITGMRSVAHPKPELSPVWSKNSNSTLRSSSNDSSSSQL